MAHVFLSYAREDKPVVESLAEGLVRAGHGVWWDAHLGAADNFRETIESKLAAADVVLVVWSRRSKASRYVLDEAERAVARGVFLPILLGGSPPLGFGTFNSLNFGGWGGDYDTDSWRRLLSEIKRIAAAPVLPPARWPLRVLRQIAIVATAWGLAFGLSLWALYALGESAITVSAFGHPLVDAIALGIGAAAPVAILSAIEIKQAGFEKLSLIARRSALWFSYGAGIALIVVALAAAIGTVEHSSPRGMASELSRALLILSAASAFVVTATKLVAYLARRAFAVRLG